MRILIGGVMHIGTPSVCGVDVPPCAGAYEALAISFIEADEPITCFFCLQRCADVDRFAEMFWRSLESMVGQTVNDDTLRDVLHRISSTEGL